MQKQVDHYLQRARVAAQRDSVVYRTPVAPLVQRMVRVLEKLNPQTDFAVAAGTEIVFAGEREDLEEIVGNLLENAMKWAKSAVSVTGRLAVAPARIAAICSRSASRMTARASPRTRRARC